ncbi:MAG: Gfo/Idh/MocA family oxidoreductase [Planctomycetes bacterium]|nr:Gfo/Idh/MocA family oxidoreductase [Planctomycetota bacterium]
MEGQHSTTGGTSGAGRSRREFLKASGGAAAAGLLGPLAVPRPGYTAEDNAIQVALVGCGGRGTGAAMNALSTRGPVRLVAMADIFPHRLEGSLKPLSERFAGKVDVPPERRFLGFDAFRKATDCLDRTGIVILATPPAFRPIQLEHAVRKGVHVFMEKSFAVDAPGVRRVLAAGEEARRKGLVVAGGLMWRHDPAREEVIRRIHDGAIGDLTLLRTYRMHGAVGLSPKKPGTSELAHQIANYSNFTWCNASFFVDWLIHNIDVCCWAKGAWPVAAQGHGGRAARTVPDQMLDHYAVEYTFEDGTKLLAQGRHIDGCWDVFSDFAHGTKGSAVLMESLAAARPRIYGSHRQRPEDETWRWAGPDADPYQVEWDRLTDAIRRDVPWNETERCAKACMTAILGRMAAESGRWVSLDEAFASELELAPGLERIASLDDKPPVEPDASGRYPIPVPGRTRAV